MEGPTVATEFIELLRRSELLPASEIDALVEQHQLAEKESAVAAARALMRARVITRLQAERLLEGRLRGLFIERYKLLEILGSGGMGWLYLAEDTGTGETVALKVLHERHKQDAGLRTRFRLEALAGQKFQHPNIVRTLRLADTDDLYGEMDFMVMEFIEAVSLQELLGFVQKVKWPQACDMIAQAALGLHHAHEAGMVHRDVKPANLLVAGNGTVKVLDFGLALLDRDAARTEDMDEFSLAMIFGHHCLGTEDYIAPEQSRDSFKVDRRADVYSLGCTLYATLTGKLPFPGKTMAEKLEGHRAKSPRPLREVVPDAPPELEAVLARMMAKEPADRYPTCAAVYEALAPFCKRKRIVFDFPEILRTRAREAYHRLAAQKNSSISASSVARRSLDSQSSPDAAHRETTLAQDTRANRPRQSSVIVAGAAQASAAELAASAISDNVAVVPSTLTSAGSREAIPLLKSRIVIGRDADCDVKLNSPNVSGRHCELRFDGTWWRLVDLDSKNGVLVNGKPVREQLVWPGDRLTIAQQYQFQLDYKLDAEHARPSTGSWAPWLIGGITLIAGAAGLAWWLLS